MEERRRKKNNAKFSGHYVYPRTETVRAHALRSHQQAGAELGQAQLSSCLAWLVLDWVTNLSRGDPLGLRRVPEKVNRRVLQRVLERVLNHWYVYLFS